MRKLLIVLISLTALPLIGCGVAPQASPEIRARAMEPLYCEGADECARYWRRAQVWVVTNSKWKIQTATDAVIVTHTPPSGDIYRAYQITREPLSGGREQIKIASGCANTFGCTTDESTMALAFKNYVKGSQ